MKMAAKLIVIDNACKNKSKSCSLGLPNLWYVSSLVNYHGSFGDSAARVHSFCPSKTIAMLEFVIHAHA